MEKEEMKKEFIEDCQKQGIDPFDPDLLNIKEGHVCKHNIRWPHRCDICDDKSYILHTLRIKHGV
jgi:hypothetical protein